MLVVSQSGKTAVNIEHAAKIIIRAKMIGKREEPKFEYYFEYYIAADNSLERNSEGFVLAVYSTEDKAIAELNELFHQIDKGCTVYWFPPDITATEANE